MRSLTDEEVKELKKIDDCRKIDLPTFENALYTIETLRYENTQHEKWNEAHTKARVELSEDNKKLKEALSQAKQALEYCKSYYHPEVVDYMRRHKGCDFNTILLDSTKNKAEKALEVIDKIGGGDK